MKKLALLLALLSTSVLISQEITTSDEIVIELLIAKSFDGGIKVQSSEDYHEKEILREVLIRCKLVAPKTPVDVNAFSLVDKASNLRYRLLRIKAYQGLFPVFNKSHMLIKKDIQSNLSLPPYKPSIEDSFPVYSLEGFQDVEIPFNFSNGGFFSKKNNMSNFSVVYYSPVHLQKFKVDIYYAVLDTGEKPEFELHYRDEKVADIDLVVY